MSKNLVSILVVLPLAGGIAAADTAVTPVADVKAAATDAAATAFVKQSDADDAAHAVRNRTLSVNLDPSGVIQGYYGGNVEWLHGSHGLIAEASYFNKGDGDTSVSGASATVGYRWHWRGRQNSGFLGVNASFGVGTASTSTTNDAGDKMMWDLSVRTISVTGNIGKRWQLANGLNITARIGAGWASRTASTSSDDPDAKEAADTVTDLLAFLPIAFDSELSLGYSF